MKIINKHINSTIIATAVTLLQATIPDLTPTSLVAAIRAYREDDTTSTKNRSKRLYRVAEVCECLQVTRQSIYNLIHKGKLVRIKIGAATRITAESLERFINNGTE